MPLYKTPKGYVDPCFKIRHTLICRQNLKDQMPSKRAQEIGEDYYLGVPDKCQKLNHFISFQLTLIRMSHRQW